MTYIPLSSIEDKLDDIITNTASTSDVATNTDNWNDGSTTWASKLESIFLDHLKELRLLRVGMSEMLGEPPVLDSDEVPKRG